MRLRPAPLTAALVTAALASAFGEDLTRNRILKPGSASVISSSTSYQRGMAQNPVTGNLILADSVTFGAAEAAIRVLDSTTGEPIRSLRVKDDGENLVVTGGTRYVNGVRCTAQGEIFVANLSVNAATNPLKIYRWENEEAPPELIYSDNPGAAVGATARYGDAIALRGSGESVEILVAGTGHLGVFYLRKDSGNWAGTTFNTAATGTGCTGITFGPGFSAFSKRQGQPLHHFSFDPVAGTSTTLKDFPVSGAPVPAWANAGPINFIADGNYLSVLDTAAHKVVLYSVSGGGTAAVSLGSVTGLDSDTMHNPAVTDTNDPEYDPGFANSNGAGQMDGTAARIYALETNNGITAFDITNPLKPPSISGHPQGGTWLTGSTLALGAAATGTPPLTYVWKKDNEVIPSASGPSLMLSDIQESAAGSYVCVVSNAVNGGSSATSNPAVIVTTPSVQSPVMELVWKKAPGDFPWLTGADSYRGIAGNPANGHVLVVTRGSGSPEIHVLDAAGTCLHSLPVDPLLINVGTNGINLNLVGVADDGAVYACNLVSPASASAPFRIYRWPSDAADAAAEMIYSGDPGLGRCGDTFDVYGGGADTRLIAASRFAKTVAVFTTDGNSWQPNLVTLETVADGAFGLGLCFDGPNSFWGKGGTGDQVHHVVFRGDFTTAEVVASYAPARFPGTALSVHPYQRRLGLAALENADNVRLYDLSQASPSGPGTFAPVLVDQEFFPQDNANGNGTAAADWNGDRLVALDTNNGLVVMQVTSRSDPVPGTLGDIVRSGGNLEIQLSGLPGHRYRIQSTASLAAGPWEDTDIVVTALKAPVTVTFPDPAPGAALFFRAKEVK